MERWRYTRRKAEQRAAAGRASALRMPLLSPVCCCHLRLCQPERTSKARTPNALIPPYP